MLQGVYQPRNPKNSPFHQILQHHYEDFLQIYQERFQAQYGVLRSVIPLVLEKYLACGDLTKGFVRIRCESCHHEYFLAFSCKCRYFCPSCHKKRTLLVGEFLTREVLAPVPHTQIVFSIPRILRRLFLWDRKLLGLLSQCAYTTLKELYQAALARKDLLPGVVIAIQTFGSLVNFHPHLHALVTCGALTPLGEFFPLPPLSAQPLEKLFAHKVFSMLLAQRKISSTTIARITSWHHWGFNVHIQNPIPAGDSHALESLIQYLIRAPFSQEKILSQDASSTLIYQGGKFHPLLQRNFQVFDPLEWIAATTAHIPDKGQHMIRYYGFYSNVSRGKRKKALPKPDSPQVKEVFLSSVAYRKRWSALIRKVYEADPLICPRCQGPMRLVAFITDPLVIDQILSHLGLAQPTGPSPPSTAPASSLSYEPFLEDGILA